MKKFTNDNLDNYFDKAKNVEPLLDIDEARNLIDSKVGSESFNKQPRGLTKMNILSATVVAAGVIGALSVGNFRSDSPELLKFSATDKVEHAYATPKDELPADKKNDFKSAPSKKDANNRKSNPKEKRDMKIDLLPNEKIDVKGVNMIELDDKQLEKLGIVKGESSFTFKALSDTPFPINVELRPDGVSTNMDSKTSSDNKSLSPRFVTDKNGNRILSMFSLKDEGGILMLTSDNCTEDGDGNKRIKMRSMQTIISTNSPNHTTLNLTETDENNKNAGVTLNIEENQPNNVEMSFTYSDDDELSSVNNFKIDFSKFNDIFGEKFNSFLKDRQSFNMDSLIEANIKLYGLDSILNTKMRAINIDSLINSNDFQWNSEPTYKMRVYSNINSEDNIVVCKDANIIHLNEFSSSPIEITVEEGSDLVRQIPVPRRSVIKVDRGTDGVISLKEDMTIAIDTIRLQLPKIVVKRLKENNPDNDEGMEKLPDVKKESINEWLMKSKDLPKNTIVYNSERIKQLSASMNRINKLIPIKISFDNNEIAYILWFDPTEEFALNLPEELKDRIQPEIDAARDESNLCKSEVKTGDKYFDVWRACSGAVENLSIFPNPAKENINVGYNLSGDRQVTISLHDLFGKRIAELKSESKTAGSWQESFQLQDIQPGMYLIVVQTDQKETAVQRFIVN